MSGIRGALATFAGGALAAAVLAASAGSLPAPPLDGFDEVEAWWRAHGTPVAVFATVRIVGLALSGYVTVLGLIATIAALTCWSWAEALTKLIATTGARRVLMGGGLAASLSVSSAGATGSPAGFDLSDVSESAEPIRLSDVSESAEPIRLSDVGEYAEPIRLSDVGEYGGTVEIRDVGPVTADPATTSLFAPLTIPALDVVMSSPPVTEDGGLTDSEWLVERGDHLWAIAAETIADRGGDQDESTIAAYWLELIDLNRDVIGEDPDLIHPGQIIRLPD